MRERDRNYPRKAHDYLSFGSTQGNKAGGTRTQTRTTVQPASPTFKAKDGTGGLATYLIATNIARTG